MKRYLFLLLALCHQLLFATETELLKQLSNVNTYWNLHTELPEDALGQFSISPPDTYHDWITFHLMLVEQNLRTTDVSLLSPSQRTNRERLLNELNSYWKGGVYPVNDYLVYKNPVFIDRDGTHCAVGYLMQQSGHEALARTIDANEKFAYVYEIKTPGVKQWADEHGFTIDELAWIQPTYSPNTLFAPVGNGTNGPVNVLVPDFSSGGLLIAGRFDTIGNSPCSNIGMYINGQLGCFGGGVNGPINDLYMLMAAGEFLDAGVVCPLAVFDNSVGVWSYYDIPAVPGGTGRAVFGGSMGNKLELIVSNPSTGKDEIWYQKISGTWEKQAVVNGVVNNIEASYSGRMYVGSFDSVLVSRPNQSDTLLLTNNVVFNDYYLGGWLGLLDDAISDTVYAAKVIGNVIYFGGTCSDSTGRSNVCLTRYLNGTLQPVLLSSLFTGNSISIRDIGVYENDLLVVGEFEFMPQLVGTQTKNIALYDPNFGYTYAYGMFNDKINTVTEWKNNWYFGGDFTSDLINLSLPHLARLDMTSTVSEYEETKPVKIYPNPTSEEINIVAEEGVVDWISVYDLAGREVLFEKKGLQQTTISLSAFESGVYLVKVSVNNTQSTTRLVKN